MRWQGSILYKQAFVYVTFSGLAGGGRALEGLALRRGVIQAVFLRKGHVL
jgi:hypothetical protein